MTKVTLLVATNLEATNSRAINSEATNSRAINPEATNSRAINPEATNSKTIKIIRSRPKPIPRCVTSTFKVINSLDTVSKSDFSHELVTQSFIIRYNLRRACEI